MAYLSGLACSGEKNKWNYDESDVCDLCDVALKGSPSFRGVDVLLTSQWPAGIVEKGKVG